MYRGLLDYAEYAFQSANQGTPGLQWQDLADDPRVGIDTTMVCTPPVVVPCDSRIARMALT